MQIARVHREDIVKFPHIGICDLAGAVLVVCDLVGAERGHRAGVGGVEEVVCARAGRVDGADSRVGICEGAEDAFSHGRAACSDMMSSGRNKGRSDLQIFPKQTNKTEILLVESAMVT